MEVSDNRTDLVGIVINLLEGKTTAAIAACGAPTPVRLVFELAHKIGRLNRGEPIELDAAECGMLYEIIEASTSLLLAGRPPRSIDEQIADMLTQVAFDNGDPLGWAVNLLMTRDCNTIWRVKGFSKRRGGRAGYGNR